MEEVIATRSDLYSTQFQHWYPIFKHLSIKSEILQLSEPVIRYLKSDGIKLPKHLLNDKEESEDESQEVHKENEQNDFEGFPELEHEIERILEAFNRETFIKTNWSAPLDATWMNGGTLKCQSINDIYLLLKSSDRISCDLENMFDLLNDNLSREPNEVVLVIRKWGNLIPSMEFRLFVYEHRLVGKEYSHLLESLI
jgi:hypothetical protein